MAKDLLGEGAGNLERADEPVHITLPSLQRYHFPVVARHFSVGIALCIHLQGASPPRAL